MNFTLSKKIKSVLIWLCSYMNFLALVLVGGYFYIKRDEEDASLHNTLKYAFIVNLIFAALTAFLSLYSEIGSLGENYYSSDAYNFYSIISSIIYIAEIVVHAVFIIIALVKKEEAN